MPAQPIAAPTDKVTAATLGAALGMILVWVLEITLGIDIPTLIEAAIAVVTTFGAGYLKTENRGYQGRHEA